VEDDVVQSERLYAHVRELFPLCRSITGEGLRATLRYIGEQIPLEMREVPSGTRVLDWEIPDEWNIRDAAVCHLNGERVIDFHDNNLHVLQYSVPVDRIVSREELEDRLFSLPNQPTLIPYRTAYYARRWGFCISHLDRLALTDASYRVVIDSTLQPGSLSYGECLLPGESTTEVLFSAHCCHPSLANDNLSAIAVAIELARVLAEKPRRFSYRFLFAPGTIGAITWLHFNRDAAARVKYGLVLSCLGDSAPPSYKCSRNGNAVIDRYVRTMLRDEGHVGRMMPFEPMGYDERQYCSPGFDLPVGCLMRSPDGTFAEYHTSADDLSFVRPEALADSLRVLQRIVMMIEEDGVWCRSFPDGEPQLGRRGLYPSIGGGEAGFELATLLWVLNLADGRHSLLDISERTGSRFEAVVAAVRRLAEAGLLERGPSPGALRAPTPDRDPGQASPASGRGD
jgi:aminopeptidase-like protein